MLPKKSEVHAALVRALREALSKAASAAATTREGATHEEARAEGDKDMRSTEQSYLARGQAMRTEELAEQLQRLELAELKSYGPGDPIGPGALVRVSIDDDERFFFVVPHGGGTELDVGVKVTVVAPSSPVGGALVGRRVGDDFELKVRGQTREWIVEEIA